MNTSVVEGSDEYFESVCQPCVNDNERKEATGYCKQCHEYLCQTCIKYHKKVSKTKGHTILNPKEISKVKVAPTSKDPLTVVCPRHDDEVIKYYCKNHNQLACSVCLSLDHRTCKDASYIPDISVGVKEGKEFQEVRRDVDKILASVAENEDKANKKMDDTVNMGRKAAKDVKAVRKEFNHYLKNIEEGLLEEIDTVEAKDRSVLEEEVKTHQTWTSELNDILHDFDEKEKHSKSNGLFIAMQQAKLKTAAVKSEVEQHGEGAQPTTYAFEKDKILQNLQSTISAMKLEFQEDGVDLPEGHLDVKSSEDTTSCYIGGLIVLPDGKLALADINNKAIKLIDPKRNTITARVTVSSSPYDLTLVNKQEIAVTLGKETKVQIMKLDGLTTLRSFSVGQSCKGIQCRNGKLYVVCQDPNLVKVFDLQGRTLHVISSTFSMPTRIALHDNGNMYVTDHVGHVVIIFAANGTEKARLSWENLTQPLGIAFNPVDSGVYVVGWSSNNILQLSSQGNLIQVLASESDGLSKPVAVACKGKTLFVSFDSSSPLANTIKMIKIK